MIDDPETAAEGASLRPNVRPWLVGGAVNLIAAAVLLGVPLSRGPARAREVAPRFAAFAACFYGAEAAERPGLGLPPGERRRYASLVLSAEAEWPARCRPALLAIPPEPTMFLFPAVKDAEARLRAAVALADTELMALARARSTGALTVSDRPMRAMGAVRGALAELGLSTGVPNLSAARDAVRLGRLGDGRLGDGPADSPTPSIVPLRVSAGGDWHVALDQGALVVSAIGSRGVARVRVADGAVDLRVTRRPASLGAMLPGHPPWLTWTTARAQCEGTGCARRSTGLAAYLEDRQTLEPMMWLGGHPVRGSASAVFLQGAFAWMVAVEEEGASVRRFALPTPAVRALGSEVEPAQIAADARWPLGALDAAARFTWLAGDPPTLAVAEPGRVTELRLLEGAEPRALPAPGPLPVGPLEAAACSAPSTASDGTDDGWLVVAGDRGAQAHLLGHGAPHPLALRLLPFAAGSLRVACSGGAVSVFALADGALSHARCTPEGCGPPRVAVPSDVVRYDVATLGDDHFIAWTDASADGPVRVTRLANAASSSGSSAEVSAITAIPAACWSDPVSGLCGEPRLVSAEGKGLFLVTRQERDLRVLTSADGATWAPLPGLEQP